MLGGDFMQNYFLLACLIFAPSICVKVTSAEKEWAIKKMIFFLPCVFQVLRYSCEWLPAIQLYKHCI